ncbi:MAG TPA: hypothetical protein DDZ88_20550 [Verrucomicrobiales bacterium]|nr:hypothetical protein [Verrucomicrobiales bacterium]
MDGKERKLHQSTDEGLNWRQRYTTKVQTVAAITPAANQGRRRADNWINRGVVNTVDNMVAVDPANPLRILVAMADRGVFASADGGASFHQYSFRFDTLQAFSAFMVAFDPVQPDVAYAGLKDALASAEGQKVTGLFKGVFQPATQDWHWSLLAGGDGSLGGLPKEALPSALAFSHDGAVMWLVARGFGSSTSASLGVWESRDSGVTWQQIGLSTRNVESIAAHPSNADILLVGVRNGRGGQGMWRGLRSGGVWTFTSTKALTAPKACYSVAFDASQPSVAYAAVGTSGADPEDEMGIYKSTDGALTWVRQMAFASGYAGRGVQSVAVTSTGLCFASKAGDFDLPAALRRSPDGGAAWSTQSPPFPEAGFLLATAGATPHLYASTAGMGLWRAPLSALTPAIEGWRQQYFGTTANSGDAADTFDFDHDGLVNLLEWSCGLDPTLSSTLPTLVTRSGGDIEFIYTRSVSAVAAGAAYTVEWSDTLVANDWSTTGVSQAELSNNGTLQQMKATLPAGSLGRRFVRLRVASPP